MNDRKMTAPLSERAFWGRKPIWIAILLGLSLLFSYFILIHFAEGGDVSWFSLFFLYLIGYFYGGWTGLACALVFSILKFFGDLAFGLVDTNHMTAEILDYLFSYTLIGVGGFFSQVKGNKKTFSDKAGSPKDPSSGNSLEEEYRVGTWPEHIRLCGGYFVAMLLRFISSVVNFVVFYYRDERSFFGNLSEALFYCIGYVGIEMVFTILFLLVLPWARNSAEYCKFVATHKYSIDYRQY